LPVSLHDKCVGWRKAAAELGIKELSALPSDLSLQTGGGRFAAEDISQGQLGDCWLLSALSLLALSPDSGLLEKVFSENPTATPDGKYVVLLHKQGKWVRVQVNDELPVNSRNELLLVRSAGGDELWPMLLEKVGTYNVAGKGCNISKHHLKNNVKQQSGRLHVVANRCKILYFECCIIFVFFMGFPFITSSLYFSSI
jgi:hypothetical protein